MQALEVICRQVQPAPDVTGRHCGPHRPRAQAALYRLARAHAASVVVRIEARTGFEPPGFVMVMTHAMAAPGGGRRGQTEELS